MSLKTAFAAVLKAMRNHREISQRDLAHVSSRTYVSKLERGQSSPTLEMMSTLSPPLGISPLGLVALTLATETGQSIKSLIHHVENELNELARAGMLRELQIPTDEPTPAVRGKTPSKRLHAARPLEQTEFCFAD
jgi:transcriptional regulator with XRE-family HTH domain